MGVSKVKNSLLTGAGLGREEVVGVPSGVAKQSVKWKGPMLSVKCCSVVLIFGKLVAVTGDNRSCDGLKVL